MSDDRTALYIELPGDMAATDFKQLLAGRVRLESLYVERTTVRTDRGDGIETDGGRAMKKTPPAPSKEISARPGGNGDQFLVFDQGDDYRHVELLNEADAR